MTTIMPLPVKCPVCENEFEIYVLGSTNAWGAPDLDLRPPEMQRSTMDKWVHECPSCGYVTPDFNQSTEITSDFLKSDSYKSCDDLNFNHSLAERFYRQYLIASSNSDKFHALLHCAWVCDDTDDEKNAQLMRRKSLEYLEKLDLNDDILIQRADLLRRSGQFERVIEEYSTKTFKEDIYNMICSFEVEKAIQKDASCYTDEDVVKS